METGKELVTKKLYQLYERDQEYQQTPFHSRHSICQIYCEAEAHLFKVVIITDLGQRQKSA